MQSLFTKFIFAIFFSFLSSQAVFAQRSYDYERIFYLTRQCLNRDDLRAYANEKFKDELEAVALKLEDSHFDLPKEAKRKLSTTQFMNVLQENSVLMDLIEDYLNQVPMENLEVSDSWKATFDSVIESEKIEEKFEKLANPFSSFELTTKNGQPGYRNIKLYANHPREVDGKLIPSDNLEQVLIDFIKGAKKEFAGNTYDFDLTSLADEYISAQDKGVYVLLGVDAGVVEHRPEVKAVYDLLKKNQIDIHAIKSVGLNHQKMYVRDWSDPKNAAVLLLSANATRSGMAETGDLPDGASTHSDLARPNANNAVFIQGENVAHVVYHDLTLGVKDKYRGREFPLSGSYKIYGPKKPNGEQPFIQLSFTPKGGMKNISKNVFGPILKEKGPMAIDQFAISAPDFKTVFYETLEKEIKETGRVPFLMAAGDGPNTMREWSLLLDFAGFERQSFEIETKNDDGKNVIEKVKIYFEDEHNQARKILKNDFERFRDGIRLSVRGFGEETADIELNGKTVPFKFTRKNHHKIFGKGDYFFVGTSFNISAGAETNREQILLVYDSDIAKEARAIVKSLWDEAVPVTQEVERRNGYLKRKYGEEAFKKMMERALAQYKVDCDKLWGKEIPENALKKFEKPLKL